MSPCCSANWDNVPHAETRDISFILVLGNKASTCSKYNVVESISLAAVNVFPMLR